MEFINEQVENEPSVFFTSDWFHESQYPWLFFHSTGCLIFMHGIFSLSFCRQMAANSSGSTVATLHEDCWWFLFNTVIPWRSWILDFNGFEITTFSIFPYLGWVLGYERYCIFSRSFHPRLQENSKLLLNSSWVSQQQKQFLYDNALPSFLPSLKW